jgi:hypothetical protein
MNMHANIQCMNMHEDVWIISSNIEILEIYRTYYWVKYDEVNICINLLKRNPTKNIF